MIQFSKLFALLSNLLTNTQGHNKQGQEDMSGMSNHGKYSLIQNIEVQVQDKNGNWLPMHTLSSASDSEIFHRMNEVKARFPNKNVRAIDQRSRSIVQVL